MRAKYAPTQTVLVGRLRTAFISEVPGLGTIGHRDGISSPIVLVLEESLDVEGDTSGGEGSPASISGLTEVQVAPDPSFYMTDWEPLLGATVEVVGELFHATTAYHHRQVLISCGRDSIRPLRPFGFSSSSRVVARGSGVLINNDGFVLTAHHVLNGPVYSVRRRLDRVEARCVGVHDDIDLALLKTDLAGLDPVRVRSSAPYLGEQVFVCGFPLRRYLGHGLSITSGLVCGGSIPSPGYFRISAPVQKGNSGGPVFDAFGNLLGIVSARTSKKLADDVRTGLGDGGAVEVLNVAVSIPDVLPFLRSQGVSFNELPGWWKFPDEDTPIPGHRMARCAEPICVEIEGWQ